MMNRGFLLKMSVDLLLSLTAGCLNMADNPSCGVAVSCNVMGAIVTVIDKDGQEVAKAATPSTVRLSAKEGFFSRAKYTFQFQKAGYKSCAVQMRAKPNWCCDNPVIGMLFWSPYAQNAWKLDNSVMAVLHVDESSVSGTNAGSSLGTSEHPQGERNRKTRELEELNAQGVLSPEEYLRRRAELMREDTQN
jgi:hypothetical protein